MKDDTIDYPNTDHIGLFGCISGGDVENLVLDGVNIKGRDNVGGIAGGVVAVVLTDAGRKVLYDSYMYAPR